MDIRADFHLHTTASDGMLNPRELVVLAKDQGLDLIAITDHDTTEGIKEALIEGEKLGIKVIPGIELSTIHNSESIHILGYFRDNSYENEEFQSFLKDMQDYRISRAKKFIANLDKFFNIKLDYEEIRENAKGVVARPHIAKAIINKGYPYSWDYIFDKLIGKNSPAYVHNKKISIEEGIDILKNLNAVVMLAHPKLVKKTPVEELIKFNFHGLEAVYYLNSEEEQNKYIDIAKKNNKLLCCGSDFHGHGKEDTKHGYIGTVNSNLHELEAFINLFLK
ncbi:PHP domain-containing protein [Clostridium sp. MSJ-4]|uniref:PHP domain-containing protein n=1 Tax=Clostridium simiarum TaxID=2841506 RepID=A0ABS6F2R7_9CLOT|nr:PHP domain-containing protein [Clostridium simiarum]MBU5592802.1 PHP domain-containing protein [Clostridium simiarum]